MSDPMPAVRTILRMPEPAPRRVEWVEEYKTRATAGVSGATPLAAAAVNAQLASAEELGRIADALEALVAIFHPAERLGE